MMPSGAFKRPSRLLLRVENKELDVIVCVCWRGLSSINDQTWCWRETDVCASVCETDVSPSGAVPQICDVTQVLGQVVFVLGLSSQLEVSAERVQPYRIGTAHKHTT